MKTIISFLLLFLFSSLIAEAQEIVSPLIKHAIPFSAGETLTYQVKYGFIVGGTTTFSLIEEVYHKKQVFHAKVVGQSTGIANALYGVKDSYESWFDKETTLPYKQIRDIKEGHYSIYNEVTYNRKNNTVHSLLSGDHKVPEKILDLCSVFYYVRRVDFSKLNEGDVVLVNMYFADEIFPFHLRYLGKETIKTKNGKVSCFKISPIVEVGRMFKTEDDLTVWFTDDESCLPVLVRMDLRLVGAVLLKLVKLENTPDSLLVRE
jgi:hypothetical protein